MKTFEISEAKIREHAHYFLRWGEEQGLTPEELAITIKLISDWIAHETELEIFDEERLVQ